MLVPGSDASSVMAATTGRAVSKTTISAAIRGAGGIVRKEHLQSSSEHVSAFSEPAACLAQQRRCWLQQLDLHGSALLASPAGPQETLQQQTSSGVDAPASSRMLPEATSRWRKEPRSTVDLDKRIVG